MPFSVGDIVRVVKQPTDMHARILGEVGFIESLHENGTHAGFCALKITGEVGSCGTVMLDCIAPESAPRWVEAKRWHDDNLARRLEEFRARTERINARIQEIAKKHLVSFDEATEIHEEIEHVISRSGWPE